MKRKRNNSFLIRLDNLEKDYLDTQIQKSGLSREAFVRSVLLESEMTSEEVSDDEEE